MPPLGVAVIARDVAPAPGLSASKTHLENAVLKATIAADGTISSLLHKPTGREALAGAGNQLWAYPVDKPRNWDAWDVDADYIQRGEQLTAVESIALVDSGPHRAALRIVRRFRASTITQTYVLTANSPRLDIETTLDWHDRRVFLRTVTPVAVRSATAAFECANGVVMRPTHANTSWDQAMYEAAAHRFVDVSEPGWGVALLNNAKYGHNVRGNVLGMSLLRSPIYPDPLADEGTQTFTYALMPHAGDWHDGGVREEAEDLNQPLLVKRSLGPRAWHRDAADRQRHCRRVLGPEAGRGRQGPRAARLRAGRRSRRFRRPLGWLAPGARDHPRGAAETRPPAPLMPFEPAAGS